MLAALVMQGPPASGAAGVVAARGSAFAPVHPAAAPHRPASSPRLPEASPGGMEGAGRGTSGSGSGASRTGDQPAPEASSSRAGSPQGEGRPRPGRPDSAVPDPYPSDGVPTYTDRDPPQARQPTGDGRRVDGDRGRSTAPDTADTRKKSKAPQPDRKDASRPQGARSRGADPDGTDRKAPGRTDTGGTGRTDGGNKRGTDSGAVGEVRAAPDKWRARPARDVRNLTVTGDRDRAFAPPRARGGSTFRPLPFGSGLILIGLGLGFLGIRLRRS